MDRRSIIFMVSHSSAGGAQEIWANLAEGFLAKGDNVQLMALYPLRADIRTTSADLPWRYVVERQPKGPLAAARMLGALTALIRREKPDVIFTAMPAANVAAALCARLAGTKTKVITSHHSPVGTHSRVLNGADSLTGSLRSVATVISVSEEVGRSLEAKPAVYRAKRRTVTNAVPPRIEALLARLAAEHAPRIARSRTVVATGRLAEQKNYPLLIRAAALMPDVTVRIVGDGPDRAALEALAAELGVTGRVEFLGHRPREEALAILAAGDVFVQISLFEGHSLGLVEAAKLGMPIVVSDVPVQIEGITAKDGTRCGLAVAIDDAQGLARHVTMLLDDAQAYAEWAALARKVGAESSYEAMMAAYQALIA
ncbi:glycosyltransferase family 4 protein [Sphingomonas sanguinis]|uniref:glycosyltransferase family 4 protein n=1 Tax=Sphingomonas sanguinis TaxID=33051 RepID=UPI001C5A2087|nr:glycosyltransferase family 4 protein [Sphingomonas sanguinis]QXT35526.1 glycosyltransferase family 4 protein [Sphingomonas sanguinis]